MQQFHVDKAANVIVEALMEDGIRLYCARNGCRISVYENLRKDLPGQKGYGETV